MASTSRTLPTLIGDTDGADTALAGTVVDETGTTFYLVKIVNEDSAQVYVRVWDATAAVTNGTTAPEWLFPCPANSTIEWGNKVGWTLANGLAMACVTDKGTSGTTAPTGAVSVLVHLTA